MDMLPVPETASFTAYGVDGCPAGWFFVALEPSKEIRSDVVETIDELVKTASDSDRIFVDIPIGLPDGPEKRECDVVARKKLGQGRRSSVFPVPVRAALHACTYEKAKQASQEATGKKISKQTFAIVPKIKEVDALLQRCSRARGLIREVHPEVCFWALAGLKPMTASKKKRAGFCERVALLKCVRPSAEEEVKRIMDRFQRKDVARDDILDAMVAAITASVNPAALQTLPPHPVTDQFGLPMEMVYVSVPPPDAEVLFGVEY